MIPERTSIFSRWGTVTKNSSTCPIVQEPITRSTPARLYQLRSNRTISPPAGGARRSAGNTIASLALGRRGQRRDAADARIEALRDALDDAALACGVATFEEDDDLELLATTQSWSFTSSGWNRNNSSK